jgi:hypothetical protein
MPKPNEKAVEEKQPPPKKPPGFRKFEKLLKQVISAPPLRKADTRHT